MKKLAFAAALATLAAGPAFAQASGNLGAQTSPSTPAQGTVADPNRAPNYTQGSGQGAGGPARELNSPTGLPPGAATAPVGTVQPLGTTTTTTTGTTETGSAPRTGSGQQSGGPARQ
ncbi:MAG: hypothetical protein AVDCRST_MAG90-51 [uncultured Microvirga sp.]|uniref:Uncharacterized protein n=1 Tax=uncultured Microvirga sp. TaxID=412392 RepID=A0A6J4KG20_9HYPH|nr:MAG: hypothetical protein AVDCRST_MAG90-51 [uncultured Microvirga sp.]